MSHGDALPLDVRLANASLSIAAYLRDALWPSGLAAFYPHPMSTQGVLEVVLSAVAVAAIGAAVVAKRHVFPEGSMGWWWYVGTLLPVAGLIQVGSQAYADRYAYVPLIGIFIAVVWSAARLTEARPVVVRRAVAFAGVAWIATLSVATRTQLPYWHDSISLFQRAIDVVPDNALAHNNLGMLDSETARPEAARGEERRFSVDMIRSHQLCPSTDSAMSLCATN
jgi:hypothetical protein